MGTGKRLAYPDFLRCIGAFFVILGHVTTVGITQYGIGTSTWMWSLGFNSLCHWAVSVYFMISGMFLLDPDKKFDTKTFYKKNVLRMVIDALVYCFIYALLDCFVAHDFSLKALILVVYYTIFGKTGYHLWYLFVLIVLYALTPVLRIFTAHAEKKQLDYVIGVWFVIVILFGQINQIAGELIGFNNLIPYYAVPPLCERATGYIGFFLLGYRLKKYPPTKRGLTVLSILAAAAAVILPVATLLFSRSTSSVQFLSFKYHLSLGNCLIAAAVFALSQKLTCGERMQKVMAYIGGNTFGVYLWHVMFVTLCFHVFNFPLDTLTPIALIGFTLAIYAVSFGLTALLRVIPGLKKLV